MSTTTNRAKERAERKCLNELIEAAAEFREIGPSVWQAAQDLLTAFEYKDNVLTSSATTALRIAVLDLLRDHLEEYIVRSKGASSRIKQTLEDIRVGMRGKCYGDDVNDIARDLLKRIDHVLQKLKSAQVSAIKLRNQGREVRGLDDLQFEIDALQSLKERFSNDWPWSSLWKPPLDKEMAERSRAAVERGDCKTIDELINA